MGSRSSIRPGRERYDDIVDAITAWHPECRASKMFSMPCVKRAGRVVFGLSRTGMVFKLTDPDAHARALAVPGAHLFDPGGRGEPFRQWVVVPPEQADEWEPLAADAVSQDHSLSPQGGIPRKRNPAAANPRPTGGAHPRRRPLSRSQPEHSCFSAGESAAWRSAMHAA